MHTDISFNRLVPKEFKIYFYLFDLCILTLEITGIYSFIIREEKFKPIIAILVGECCIIGTFLCRKYGYKSDRIEQTIVDLMKFCIASIVYETTLIIIYSVKLYIDICMFYSELWISYVDREILVDYDTDAELRELEHLCDKYNQHVCVVCLDEFKKSVIIRCGHRFHFDCLQKWGNHSNLCPTCKHNYKFN